MNARACGALDGADPLAFMAACGLLRVVSRTVPDARLAWSQDGRWSAVLHTPVPIDAASLVVDDLGRWRRGHAAVNFAVAADRKIQDLKHPPEDFRALMRSVALDDDAAAFVAAFATGVAVDGSGQTKPTSLHFCAGQQRFMDAVLDLRDGVTQDDVGEALDGPWVGRTGTKDTRWRAASERSRALLAFDPSKTKDTTVPGAAWLAFQAMPLFVTAPRGLRVRTTGFEGRGHRERFAWPLWTAPLSVEAVRTLVGTPALVDTTRAWREARGVTQVFEAAVVRSSQGYGNFAAANPR